MKPVRRISQPAVAPAPSGGGRAASRSGDGFSRPYVPRQGRSAARVTVKGDTVAPDTRKAVRPALAPAAALSCAAGVQLVPSMFPDRRFIATEGRHGVALQPVASGGFAYELVYFQSVTGKLVPRAVSPLRDAVLSSLYWLECRHAEPLGVSGASFGLRLHRRMCAADMPRDLSALSAADAARMPCDLDCGDGL